MSWYVSYRSSGAVVMNVFKRKDLAIGAALDLLDVGCHSEIMVGPMLEPPEGNILTADDLRRIDRSG
ncbi:MAG TPA: hypothetical protein VE993_13615 [Stellaceae bacterium]|jgi:hypothetical protein|nr:hypothetical protein [Stellaceae bacterium]